MTRYLLDTHILLRSLRDDTPQLSAVVLALLSHEKRDVELFVSIASFWECAVKISKGKLGGHVSEFLQYALDAGLEILPIKPEHLQRLETLPFLHKDPFDRLMIVQAQAEDLIFVTVDSDIRRYDVSTIS